MVFGVWNMLKPTFRKNFVNLYDLLYPGHYPGHCTFEAFECDVESWHQNARYVGCQHKLHSKPRHTLAATPKLPETARQKPGGIRVADESILAAYSNLSVTQQA